MSYERSTFIGKLEELRLSGLPLELLLVVVGGREGVGGGGMYSGDSSVDGDSILIAQQPKAVEGVGRNGWKLWETGGSSGRHSILCIIYKIRRRCFVDGSEFGKKGELQQEACVCSETEVQQREWSKWESNHEGNGPTNCTSQLKCLHCGLR